MISHAIIFKEASDLRALVEANDYLRQIYRDDKSIVFPSIVVLGEQSHGKTSLIENITNLNLPRGTGIQTRVPTEIRLRNGQTNTYKIIYTPRREYEQKVIDFTENNLEAIMRKVQAEVTGNDNAITDDLIVLQIERPDLLPLTFVDLPGYIVQSSTDLKVDVEEIIRNIYVKYICNPNNQLLVVMNAANDIENSQIIKLCRKYDPKCERVMLCANKIDLRPTNGFSNYLKAASAFNINRLFFVRNKTEEERKEGRRLDEIREIEKKFISSHPELSKFDAKMLGIIALRNYLVEMQKEKIFPAIRNNYEKVIQTLSNRRMEQFEMIKYAMEPDDFRVYVRDSLEKVFAEAEQTFSEHSKSFHKTNYYRNVHGGDKAETCEAKFPSMNTAVGYTVTPLEDSQQVEVVFTCKFANVFYAEVISENQIKTAVQLAPDAPSKVALPAGPFSVAVWLMQDYHYFTFQNKIKNLYLFYKTQYDFDYFLGKNFAVTYRQHEMLLALEQSMLEDVASAVHNEILLRQIIPKFLAEVEELIRFSKDFIQGLFVSKIGYYFQEYPFVMEEISKEVRQFFARLFEFLDPVFAIFVENLYETHFSNRNDRFLSEFLQSLVKEKASDRVKDMLAKLTGIESFEGVTLDKVADLKAYNCGVKLFLTVTYKFQYFIENLANTLRNKLIRGPLVDLKTHLLGLLQDKRFKDEEELRLLMRPNEALYQRQVFLKNEVQKAEAAIEKMKNLRERFPHLRSEFDYLDKIQAVKLENMDEKLRAKITAFLASFN